VRATVVSERIKRFKEHAVAVALAMRETGMEQNDLVIGSRGISRLGLDAAALRAAFAKPLEFAGAAAEQTKAFVRTVEEIVARNPEAAKYEAEPIL